jgi:erythromycin esterase-like protein
MSRKSAETWIGGSTQVRRLVRFIRAFKRARQFGFTLLDAYLAARANSH